MSYTFSDESLDVMKARLLRDGFNGLKDGSLFMLLGTLLTVIGIIGLMIGSSVVPSTPGPSSLTGVVASALGLLILVLIGAVFSLLGLFKWLEGGRYFKQFDAYRLGYGESGPKYMLYGVFIIIFGIVVTILSAVGSSVGGAFAGIGIIILGSILSLVGIIFYGIFLLRLDELRSLGLNTPEFKIDAIFWFIGIIFSIFTVIAVILIYIHAKEAVEGISLHPALSPRNP